ncbi:DEAD/DEAH box helicase [Macrococcoides canis]|uniref:DEAD/DEAH box helicase n=1 Tax=Macrococcoides canis TaxID=1855823 RepID=UPI001E2BD12E|nr:DEAD/DEAH box helicase [Macrococcus canis]
MKERIANKIILKDELMDFEENWKLIKKTSPIIDSNEGRKIIIHILEIWDKVNNDSKEIWIDLIERAGYYPYLAQFNLISKESLSLQSKIRVNYYKSSYLKDVYFHEEQKKIEKYLSLGKNIAVSAPTSFGKSLLIEEIIARNKYYNILIIQPTLALIDETRRKLLKYISNYNIIVNTKQEVKEKNIFILTSERVLEFSDLPKIDFLIIDEFYKISNRKNDSRIDALNIAFIKIMKDNPQSMFLTPSIELLSEKFLEKYSISFFKTDYTLVNNRTIEIRTKNGKLYSGKNKKEKLFELLNDSKNNSIVYVKSPQEAIKLSLEYLQYNSNNIKNKSLDLYEWIDNNISEKWCLKQLLSNGIGIHNGILPRHLLTEIIKLFNANKLDVLFVTASLIEGVNTNVKNVIIYSDKKGNNKIDYFDYTNIKGRAGRFGYYLSGNIYLFIEQLKKEDFELDVPAVDQEVISDEVLINIPRNEVKDIDRIEKLIEDIPEDLEQLIKSNYISIKGQKEMYYYFLNNIDIIDRLRWNDIPKYNILLYTLNIAYKFLKKSSNEKLNRKNSILCLKMINHPLKIVIKDQVEYLKKEKDKEKDYLNIAINQVLNFQKNFANFEIPRLLKVVESIYNYVLMAKGEEELADYSRFISLLEGEKVDKRLQFLLDYGIPSSALRKIEKNIPLEIESNIEITRFIKENYKIKKDGLIDYELRLIKSSLNY